MLRLYMLRLWLMGPRYEWRQFKEENGIYRRAHRVEGVAQRLGILYPVSVIPEEDRTRNPPTIDSIFTVDRQGNGDNGGFVSRLRAYFYKGDFVYGIEGLGRQWMHYFNKVDDFSATLMGYLSLRKLKELQRLIRDSNLPETHKEAVKALFS